MGRLSRSLGRSLVAGLCLLAAPAPARAFEVSGTAYFGAFQVGTTARFTVAPGLAVRFGNAEGFNLTLHDGLLLFPGPGPFGLNNQLSAGVGWSWPTVDLDVAASLSAYWMHACGDTLCGRVVGLAPGGRARVSYFPFDMAGVALTADAGWYGGSSLVLPGGLAVTVIAGPVIRWKR